MYVNFKRGGRGGNPCYYYYCYFYDYNYYHYYDSSL